MNSEHFNWKTFGGVGDFQDLSGFSIIHLQFSGFFGIFQDPEEF